MEEDAKFFPKFTPFSWMPEEINQMVGANNHSESIAQLFQQNGGEFPNFFHQNRYFFLKRTSGYKIHLAVF